MVIIKLDLFSWESIVRHVHHNEFIFIGGVAKEWVVCHPILLAHLILILFNGGVHQFDVRQVFEFIEK